jgi:aquaporin Z
MTNIQLSMKASLSEHWPEYLIEIWLLGCFMIAVGVLVTIFESPRSLLYMRIPSETMRIVLLAASIGAALGLLIQSPWGKRSGAHMNPAITIAFLRLKKIQHWDALFYVFAQTVGGMLGVVVVAWAMGSSFTDPPVQYAVTVPGPTGVTIAFMAEISISFCLMATILVFVSSPQLIRFTPLAIGVLVAVLIILEAPLSGASMNPARTLASAVPGKMWRHVWLYLAAPTVGMLLAAQLHTKTRTDEVFGCAKLLHSRNVRCIHCGYLCD